MAIRCVLGAMWTLQCVSFYDFMFKPNGTLLQGSIGTANACSSVMRPLDGMSVVIKILNTTLDKGVEIRHRILVSRLVRIRGPAGNSSAVYEVKHIQTRGCVLPEITKLGVTAIRTANK